jgi:hypothetical protein
MEVGTDARSDGMNPTAGNDLREWCQLANWCAFEIYGARNTCIATSHALAAFLRARGLSAEPFRAEVHAHARVSKPDIYGFGLGWDGDGSRRPKVDGWRGHLAVSCGDWVLDPTIDQADVGGVTIEPAAFRKPAGWTGGQGYQWTERGINVRYSFYRRQVGWKSAPAARRCQWADVLDLMEIIAENEGEAV